MANKMKVWPGPRIMVPMATDILLVGNVDIPGSNPATGTPLASTKINYAQLFLQQLAEPTPFQLVDSKNHLQPGAHIMWTLPYSLRQSKQSKDSGEVNFPFVPNRWLITRFEYTNLKDGSAPNIVSNIVVSDAIVESSFPPPAQQSQYPEAAGNFPFSTIGKSMPLSQWTGDNGPGEPFLQSAGPGALSWSVSYDNVRNVFGFYDNSLSSNANSNNPYYYSYNIIGWYADPESDVLSQLPTDGDDAEHNWQAALQNNFNWTVGENSSDVENAIAAWKDWQQAHGLNGVFDPNALNLPPQAKAAIIAWHNWQQANGASTPQPDLAKQLLCHSMVGTVLWNGFDYGYGSGVPLSLGEFPTIAIGNNSVEAISIYMANQIVNDPGKPQPIANIPIIARALEAFQQDLLYDYGKDPILVENLLHNAAFSKVSAGDEWIVAGEESSADNPVKTAGTQGVDLDAAQTDLLTELNTAQNALNALNNTIATQRNELYLLDYKINIINNNDGIPACVQTSVTQSYTALSTELQKNLNTQSQLTNTIDSYKQQLTTSLGTAFNLKSVVQPHFYAPNDPVIMVAGSRLDTKLTSNTVNMSNELLGVRYTGQFITDITISYDIQGANTPYTIGAAEILDKISFPLWNAFPKETFDLWVEGCILDTSAAPMLAVIYFEKRNIPPAVYNAKTLNGGKQSPLEALTLIIQTNQTKIWNDADELEIPPHALVLAAGMTGIAPAPAGVAFRKKQPWTPVFMDYSVQWFPSSPNSTAPFDQWALEEIDYVWNGNTIPVEYAEPFFGRTIINPAVAQNIQLKIASFKTDPNYNNLPAFVQEDLRLAASLIPSLDIVTQSINGFTEQLVTKKIAMNLSPTDGANGNTKSLLDGESEYYVPVMTVDASKCACNDPSSSDKQYYSPIRSGHFQLLNVWVIDSFGQIMQGADIPINTTPTSPLNNVLWSESLETSNDKWDNTFGQLPPRLSQGARASMNLLKSTDDNIISNASDATSPICGWVMPNHLDSSLMVFDADGNNKGAIIRIESEQTSSNRSIRWDAAPGLDTALGAPPDLNNSPHLEGFINGLLRTRFDGADAYDDLMAAIDSALWTMSSYAGQDGNLSLLLGRPLAVVRAEVMLNLSGDPAYNQGWCETGQFYNKNGVYEATNPPFMSVPFSLRIGDAFLVENGVMGYFQDDNYDTFYPVYGVNGQTATIIEIMRAGLTLDFEPPSSEGFKTNYVKSGHLVPLMANGQPVKLTILVDPVGNIPIFPGSLPYSALSLPNGPVSNALKNLKASFRTGPLLLDPNTIKMPTPAEVNGKWDWVARRDVSNWNEEMPIGSYNPSASLSTNPLRLIEGWLNLSETESKKN